MSDEAQVTEAAISAAIRARCGVLDITNKELAERAGISERTLYNYLRGESKLFIAPLMQITGALNTTVDAIVLDAAQLIREGRVPGPEKSAPGQ
jgi:transcriptional regulator with XRE-family HTH domain